MRMIQNEVDATRDHVYRARKARDQVYSAWVASDKPSEADIVFGAVIHTLSCVFGNVFSEGRGLTDQQDKAVSRAVDIMRDYFKNGCADCGKPMDHNDSCSSCMAETEAT